MLENKNEGQPNSFPERSIKYGGSFIFKGKFPDGAHIQHNNPYSAWMIGEPDYFLTVYDEDLKDIQSVYNRHMEDIKLEFESYPQNNNGLSKDQYIRTHAAYLTISDFNGKLLTQSSGELFSTPYRRSLTPTLRVADFRGKGEIVCLEAAVIAQQLLSQTDDIFFISGFMDTDKDELSIGLNLHAFNLIKPVDNSKHPVYLWDITNPHIYPKPDGHDFTWEPYCIPLSPEQLLIFEKGEDLVIPGITGTRRYSFRGGSIESL